MHTVTFIPNAAIPHRERILCKEGNDRCLFSMRTGYPCCHAAFVLKACGVPLKRLKDKGLLSEQIVKKYTVRIYFYLYLVIITYVRSITTCAGTTMPGIRHHMPGSIAHQGSGATSTWRNCRG
jgi:hypothetical protein